MSVDKRGNHMKVKTIIAFLSVSLFICAGCGERHSEEIDKAYQLAGVCPERALYILDHVDRKCLVGSEKARFALVYTLAQDKSGLDVDNDSLLRMAYGYYKGRTEDTLYAKCQYYMGKYYMLNDSSEQAKVCFQRSVGTAEKRGDKYTQSLALEKLSRLLYNTDPQKALFYARKSDSVYCSLPGATLPNKIYGKLNICEALLFADSLHGAMRECEKAIDMALGYGDSMIISDVFQDMSSILSKQEDNQKSLEFSKKAYAYAGGDDVSKLINLAWAYMEADSLKACEQTISQVNSTNVADLYTKYYILHVAFIKGHDYEKARQYADSAYHYIETMYGEQLQRQQHYYASLVKVQHEKGVKEGHASLYCWLFVVTICSAAIIIGLLVYSIRQYKAKVKIEKEKEAQEREMAERLRAEEMRHKDMQISTMAGYILKKIDIAQKVENLKENKDKSMPLSEDDWEEIRIFVDELQDSFAERLRCRFPDFKDTDIRFMLLVRLGLSSKSMAMVYGISEKSIRQRMYVYKKSMNIECSLREFIQGF